MSIGSTVAVESAMEQYHEECTKLIAKGAAHLVAARDMSRTDAIQEVTEWLRSNSKAADDVTGGQEMETKFPFPSAVASRSKIAAIEHELLDAARSAADTL